MIQNLHNFRARMLDVMLPCALLMLIFVIPARAQTQTDQGALRINDSVTGALATGETHTYTFNGVAGQVVSFYAQGDGNLDPMIALSDGSGRELIANDDLAYPDARNALLEAITLPRIDTYTLTLIGYGTSEGEYTLTVNGGYANLAIDQPFIERPSWDVQGDGNLGYSAEALAFNAEVAPGEYRLAFDPDADEFSEFYASLTITAVTNPTGWSAGIAAQVQSAPETYYALLVNDDGLWRFIRRERGTETILRDWAGHPSIRAGERPFRTAILYRNGAYDLFYNDSLLGTLDDAALEPPGRIGAIIGGSGSLPGTTSATFDDWIVSTPLQIDEASVQPINVIVGDAATMSQALIRRAQVGGAGRMSLTVPSSSVVFGREGVDRLMLGQATRYENFALGTNVVIGAGANGLAGCGLVFRYTGANAYTLAFLDSGGGYGISERQDDAFQPGLFGEDRSFETLLNSGESHHLLIVADGNTLTYYIDGRFVGAVNDPAREGEIGTAVVNYQTISTTCEFRDLWLWSW